MEPNQAHDAMADTKRAAMKALTCLYIAVEAPIADDVGAKVSAAFDAYEAAITAAASRSAAAEQGRDKALDFIEGRGYRRCDIAACNCGGWHGGAAEDRLREISELMADAGVPGGTTIQGGMLMLRERAEAAETRALRLREQFTLSSTDEEKRLNTIVADLTEELAGMRNGEPMKCKAGMRLPADEQDCGWPTCGCDAYAMRVLDAVTIQRCADHPDADHEFVCMTCCKSQPIQTEDTTEADRAYEAGRLAGYTEAWNKVQQGNPR
jgi:hypothetical protein